MDRVSGARVLCIREELVGLGQLLGVRDPAAFALTVGVVDRWCAFARQMDQHPNEARKRAESPHTMRSEGWAQVSKSRFTQEAWGLLGRDRIKHALEDAKAAGIVYEKPAPPSSKYRASQFWVDTTRLNALIGAWMMSDFAPHTVKSANALVETDSALLQINQCTDTDQPMHSDKSANQQQSSLTDSSKQNQSSDTQQQDAAAVDKLIVSLGEILSEAEATEMVSKYGLDRVQRNLDYMNDQSDIKNPSGYLIKAVAGDWASKPMPQKWQKRRREDEEITGKRFFSGVMGLYQSHNAYRDGGEDAEEWLNEVHRADLESRYESVDTDLSLRDWLCAGEAARQEIENQCADCEVA